MKGLFVESRKAIKDFLYLCRAIFHGVKNVQGIRMPFFGHSISYCRQTQSSLFPPSPVRTNSGS